MTSTIQQEVHDLTPGAGEITLKKRRSQRIAFRFALVIGVLVPTLGAVGWVGLHGMQSGRNAVDSLYADHLTTIGDAATLSTALQDADLDSIELLSPISSTTRLQILSNLVTVVLPEVNSSIALVDTESANDPLEQPRTVALEADWSKFQAFVASGTLAGTKVSAHEEATELQANAIFGPATAAAKQIIATEKQEAKQAYVQALASYRSSVRWMLVALIMALAAVTVVVGWLIRSVLRRTLEYSAFRGGCHAWRLQQAPRARRQRRASGSGSSA